MRFATAHKAEAGGHQEEIPSVTIIIAAPAPNLDHLSMEEIYDLWRADAERLSEALWTSLPGATMDALIGLLFQRRADHFLRVTMP